MLIHHPLNILCVTLLIAGACGRSEEGVGTAGTEATPIAGMYEVKGATIESSTGKQREISGSVILAEEGGNYTATYHLTTVFEGEEGVLAAEVIGKGAGVIEGRTLRGDAQTQLVIASVPGIDPGFAFTPRTATACLVSKSVTSIAADGTVAITILNSPAAGEAYSPTRTTLHGIRVAAEPLEGTSLPNVATE